MRISDWSSDVCSSDLASALFGFPQCTGLDGAHRNSMELERQVRRLRDDIGRGRGPKEAATATARPAAKKPATKKAAARKPAAKKAAVKEPGAVKKQAAAKIVKGKR